MLERSAESEAGDHDEAAITLIDLAIVWAVLLLVSATLADMRAIGWMPIDLWIVLAPAVLPALVLAVVLLVALSGDLVAAWRGRDR